MNYKITLAACTAILFLAAPAIAAPMEYASGHQALEYFDEAGVAASPTWVKAWLGFLIACFTASLLFVWKRTTARLALVGFLGSMLFGDSIFQMLGLPYLSGGIAIAHILFWTPALVILLRERAFLNAEETKPYRIWTGAMTFTILFSFLFDIRDAAIYIAHFAG